MFCDKIKSYEAAGKFVKVTPAVYKEEYTYLKEVDILALANAQPDFQSAFRNCFDKSRKKRNGFPKFKSARHSRKYYKANNRNGTVDITGNAVRLPEVGKVKAVILRQPGSDRIIKSATISKERDGKYYASVLFEFENAVASVPVSDNAIVSTMHLMDFM